MSTPAPHHRRVERVQVTLETHPYLHPDREQLVLRIEVRCGGREYYRVEPLERDDATALLEHLLDRAKAELLRAVRGDGP